jgi:hypothetical protein
VLTDTGRAVFGVLLECGGMKPEGRRATAACWRRLRHLIQTIIAKVHVTAAGEHPERVAGAAAGTLPWSAVKAPAVCW